MLQAQDLLDGIYFSIAIDLGDAGIPHIQQLASANALWGSQGWLTHFMDVYSIADHTPALRLLRCNGPSNGTAVDVQRQVPRHSNSDRKSPDGQ